MARVKKVQSIHDIDFEKLLNSGKRIFLFDFDNTINVWRSTHVPEQAAKLFDYLKSKGAEIYIVSNGRKRNLDYEVPVIWRAFKPLAFKVRLKLKQKLKQKEEIVVIGDQIFTDVLFAKLLGVDVIKVEPIDKSKEAFGTRILRFFEKLLHRLTHRSRRE